MSDHIHGIGLQATRSARMSFDALLRSLCPALMASALLAVQPVCAQSTSPTAIEERYAQDFDAAWTFVRDNYAYFHQKQTNWELVRTQLGARAKAAKSDREFIGVLETMLEQLYDSHAHLGVNTPDSPRLIPSATDVWAEHRDGSALITAVRADSQAERAGLREGMEIVSINGRSAREAVIARRPRALRAPDQLADDWALRAELAGHRSQPVRLEVRFEKRSQHLELNPEQREQATQPLAASLIERDIGYIRIHNSLGDNALIAAWDAALLEVRDSRGLVLDLRDTPSGGNSTVARAILGRLVVQLQPYQRHELPSEERESGVKRVWVEYVAPRGPFVYDKPIIALVGRWTGSMGEGIAIGLDGMQRATIVGTPMAQLLGATEGMTLPHTRFEVRVPTERLYHVDGTPREAFRPQPPIAAETSRDVAVTAAVTILRRTLKPAS
jgi:C-terminal processing protease CtpA/Prc